METIAQSGKWSAAIVYNESDNWFDCYQYLLIWQGMVMSSHASKAELLVAFDARFN